MNYSIKTKESLLFYLNYHIIWGGMWTKNTDGTFKY